MATLTDTHTIVAIYKTKLVLLLWKIMAERRASRNLIGAIFTLENVYAENFRFVCAFIISRRIKFNSNTIMVHTIEAGRP